LPLAAYAATHGSNLSAAAIYAIGSVICHQRPERSFHLWSAQLPVCARCTGIYFGAALGGVVAILTAPRSGSAVWQSATPARIALALAVAPAALSLVYEWVTGDTPSNMLRAATGIVLGVVAAWVVVREIVR